MNQLDLLLCQGLVPGLAGGFVCDQGIDICQVADFHEGGLVEFGVICQQQGFASLLEHDLLYGSLLLVGLHETFLPVQRLAADQHDVCIVAQKGFDGAGSREGHGIWPEGSASGDDAEVGAGEVVGQTDGIGDDGDVLQTLEPVQQGEAGGGGIHHDGISFADQRLGLFCNVFLPQAVDGAALEEGKILPCLLGENSPSVAAAEDILIFQLLQISPHRLLRHLEKLAQFRNIDLLFLLDLVHDMLSSFNPQHNLIPFFVYAYILTKQRGKSKKIKGKQHFCPLLCLRQNWGVIINSET